MKRKKRTRRLLHMPRLLMYDRSDMVRFSEKVDKLADLVVQLDLVAVRMEEERKLLSRRPPKRPKPPIDNHPATEAGG